MQIFIAQKLDQIQHLQSLSCFFSMDYVNIDASRITEPIAYEGIFINSKDLFSLFPFDYQKLEIPTKPTKSHHTEDTEFITFACRYFFDTPFNIHYTLSSKKLSTKLQEKYFELK